MPGCWCSFSIADVDFIMLDGRYYRTDPKVAEPTMLGPYQLKWLKNELGNAKGTFKVICSPVLWDYRTKGDSLDTWNGYRSEREAIFDLSIRGKSKVWSYFPRTGTDRTLGEFVERTDTPFTSLIHRDSPISTCIQLQRSKVHCFRTIQSNRSGWLDSTQCLLIQA